MRRNERFYFRIWWTFYLIGRLRPEQTNCDYQNAMLVCFRLRIQPVDAAH